jgi:hypothetical protein
MSKSVDVFPGEGLFELKKILAPSGENAGSRSLYRPENGATTGFDQPFFSFLRYTMVENTCWPVIMVYNISEPSGEIAISRSANSLLTK